MKANICKIQDKRLLLSRKFKRLCYIVVMFLNDDEAIHLLTYWDKEKNTTEFSLKSILTLSEENFYKEEFDYLLKIFPNAGDVLKRNKFFKD
jgi:hypothetical protein